MKLNEKQIESEKFANEQNSWYGLPLYDVILRNIIYPLAAQPQMKDNELRLTICYKTPKKVLKPNAK